MSYITLLCKDDNHVENMKNYRPISLLNVDYKILSKLLCNRLKPLLADIIHPDQTCAVPGRTILDSCSLIRDQVDFCNTGNSPGLLLSVDQEKAFDRVSHQYLCNVLKAFGLSDTFIRWITTLYTDISSCVIVNQHVSAPIAVRRSVRQGCPLSPLLYIMCLKSALHKIRLDAKVVGLRVPGNRESTKAVAFADDSKYLLTDLASARRVIHWFNQYGRASGARLSCNKTEGMMLGRNRAQRDLPRDITWVEQMNVSGVKIGNVTPDDVWHPLVKKVDNTIGLFSNRVLSVYGRAKLINTMVLSRLWYVATVLPPPPHYINLIQRKVFDFLWSSRNEQVKRDTMYLPTEKGGTGVVNIKLKVQSLLLTQVAKVAQNAESVPWTRFRHMYLGLMLRKLPGYVFNNIQPHCVVQDAAPFYKECLQAVQGVIAAKPNFSFSQGQSCKYFYHLLLEAKAHTPKVCSTFPHIPFQKAFRDLKCKHLDPLTLNVCFKLCHDVLPVAYRLFLWNYPVAKYCSFCRTECETEDHLFYSCSYVYAIKNTVSTLIEKVSNLTLTTQVIRFGPLSKNVQFRSTALILLSEYRYAIWTCRNRARFDKKQVLPMEISQYFCARLSNRIHVDQRRLPPDRFTHLWVSPGLCQVGQRGRITLTIL